jgi:Kef-type K+ transport system membrane component KefB
VGAVLHSPLALFIIQAGIVILVSRLIGIVVRGLSQPMVIAEMVAGIMLGPSLLGWLLPGVSKAIFPAASLPLLGMVAQVGLILFMFLVGLELDPKLLRGRGHTSIVISHTSIIVPFGLGALLALYLYPRISTGSVPFSSFVLFMGVAMSITAFPVLARILVERRLLRTKVGAVTIACAAVDDVTAWCLLAFVVSVVRATNILSALWTTLLAVAYIVFMLLAARPFLRRLVDRSSTEISQNLIAVTLLLLFASSFLTELIGIHALFGAFLFGAVVPKERGIAQHIAQKIEDLVVVLMLPLFFAYSGLRTQIGLLNSASGWTMCALVVLVACLGKFGGSAVAAKLTGLGWRESSAIGILMNTRGLMELIVLNIGLDLGVIPPALFAMMVIMALVTTFMTSPLLERIYPLEELARELIEEPVLPPAKERAYTVLLCVSYERSGPALVTLGGALAGQTDTRGRIYALRLVPPANRASFDFTEEERITSEAALTPLLDRARTLDLEVRPLSFVSPQPAKDICEVAEVKQADLIMLGWHKPLLGTAMLGGTVHDVMQRAKTDVGVLIDRGLTKLKRVLVPYLGSDHDRGALKLAQRLARHTGATVTILHVVSPERGGQRLGVEERMQEVFHNGPEVRHTEVVLKTVQHANPAEAALAEASNDYDLVLIGAEREWGLSHRLFGLLPETLLAKSPVSVLVVRRYASKEAKQLAADQESEGAPPRVAPAG